MHSLSLKIILLVRDPRGVYHSRKQLKWCQENVECSEIETYCNILQSNHEAFKTISEDFPNQLRYDFLCQPLQIITCVGQFIWYIIVSLLDLFLLSNWTS